MTNLVVQHPVIILTWSHLDGMEPTGGTVMRDGYQRAAFKVVKKSRALCWSTNLADLDRARAYATANGYTVRVMEDTREDPNEVLRQARELSLAEDPILPN
jgi:hypothetical protein